MALSQKLLISLVTVSGLMTACKKDSKKTDTAAAVADTTTKLTSGTLVVDYVMGALSSVGATQSSTSSLHLDETGSTKYPGCSSSGSNPWDTDTNTRMAFDNKEFARRTFMCQFRSDESPETVMGTFAQVKQILCELERSAGTLEYTVEGKVYDNLTVNPSTGCGFSDAEVAEISAQTGGKGFPGKITATLYGSDSKWQKSVHLVSETAGADITLYLNVTSTSVAFKEIESWTQAAKIQSGDYNHTLASDATATRGAIVSIDLTTGELRSESADTYWSRRGRIYAKGTFDKDKGTFSDITVLQGIFANFDKEQGDGQATAGLYGEVETVKGDSTAGYMYQKARYECGGSCDVTAADPRSQFTLANENHACSVDGGCAGNDGILFGTSNDDYGFLMSGAAWKDQQGSIADFEAWLKDGGPLTFTSVSKSATVAD